MFNLHFLELAGLLALVLLISIGVILWMKSQKKQPHPMLNVLVLVVMLVMIFAGLKYGGETLGFIAPSSTASASDNPYRQALLMLQEPYSSYTSANNLASTNRESLANRFMNMERLDLADLKPAVANLRAMIESAPATGQTGIYNMRMTSDIQARWDELRIQLQKRAER